MIQVSYILCPKWKLKANWVLAELIRIWRGEAKAETLFAERNFISIFINIMEQYLQDCGFTSPHATLTVYLSRRRVSHIARHGVEPTFMSQAREAEWIAEAVALYGRRPDLIVDDTLEKIFRLAHAIEDIISVSGSLPFGYLQSVEELINMPVPDPDELPTMTPTG